VAHHRKRSLWTPGDGLWVSQGNRPVQVVETEYGRLGLMICHDVHVMPELLGKEKADIVLYSVGWYGPNTDNWYRNIFPERYVMPNGFSIMVANWSADKNSPGWPGHGYSCVIDRQGRVLAMAKSQKGEEIVYADLPIIQRKP
jgi:predicted amidohydrolase